MNQEQTQSIVREKIRFGEPRKYNVVIYNDEQTTMDFVITMLMSVFAMRQDDATSLMLKIHNEGVCFVGPYSYDIAMSKARKATDMARRSGFPLLVTVERADT